MNNGVSSEWIVAKVEGEVEYAMQADGTWKPYLGDRIVAPVVEFVGPDKESIVLHVQEIRDAFGRRDSHNVRICICRWVSPQCLRLALTASSKNYQPGRIELADLLLEKFNDNSLHIKDWESQSIALHAIKEHEPVDRAVCALVAAEAEE